MSTECTDGYRMELPCACNDSGRQIIHTIVDYANRDTPPLDEILQLHQIIHPLGPAVRGCLFCSTNDDVVLKLLDGLARLGTLYQAAQRPYSKPSVAQATGNGNLPSCSWHTLSENAGPKAPETTERAVVGEVDSTPGSVGRSMPSVVLGRMELMESEASLVAVTLIKQGLSQTGSHLRDLQHHLTKCMVAGKITSGTYDTYRRRIADILNGIYSSLACIYASIRNKLCGLIGRGGWWATLVTYT